MGPLIFISGIRQGCPQVSQSGNAFNGAADLHQRNLADAKNPRAAGTLIEI
jgi:hypothetical protein